MQISQSKAPFWCEPVFTWNNHGKHTGLKVKSLKEHWVMCLQNPGNGKKKYGKEINELRSNLRANLLHIANSIMKHSWCSIDFQWELCKDCVHVWLSPSANVRLTPSWFLDLDSSHAPHSSSRHTSFTFTANPLTLVAKASCPSDPEWQLYSGCHCLPWRPTNDA